MITDRCPICNKLISGAFCSPNCAEIWLRDHPSDEHHLNDDGTLNFKGLTFQYSAEAGYYVSMGAMRPPLELATVLYWQKYGYPLDTRAHSVNNGWQGCHTTTYLPHFFRKGADIMDCASYESAKSVLYIPNICQCGRRIYGNSQFCGYCLPYTCENCGKPSLNPKYCCMGCMIEGRNTQLVCSVCGKQYISRNNRGTNHFCSRTCKNKYLNAKAKAEGKYLYDRQYNRQYYARVTSKKKAGQIPFEYLTENQKRKYIATQGKRFN